MENRKLTLAFDIKAAKKALLQGIKNKRWKLEDLDTPPSGWYLANGYEKNMNGEWEYLQRTNIGSRSLIPKHKLPVYKNLLRE